MSDFMDRARAEAEREVARRNWSAFKNEGEYLSSAWCQGFEKGFTEGAAWATRQPPTDAEVEAAAQAMFATELTPRGVAYESDWNDPDLRRYWRDAARVALFAAMCEARIATWGMEGRQ